MMPGNSYVASFSDDGQAGSLSHLHMMVMGWDGVAGDLDDLERLVVLPRTFARPC